MRADPREVEAMTAVELVHHTFSWEIAPGIPGEPGPTRPSPRTRPEES